MLQRGDQVPHFDVWDLNGHPVSYSVSWQHKNLVLVVLPLSGSESTSRYLTDFAGIAGAFGRNTTCVITRDTVPGISAPAVVVADKWGEINYVGSTTDVADLPPPRELLEWVSYLETKCPECEGEAR